MAVNAYDVQVCLWKMLKLSSKTCVAVSLNHPYLSSSFFFLFFLYICFPLVFWILIYSLPLVICTCIVLSISFSAGSGTKYGEDGEREANINGGNCSRKTTFAADDCGRDNKSKKPYARVHSVRRRRAKELMREDEAQRNVEEKNAVSSTNFNCDVVDKNALMEESPKEIREVEVDFSPANTAKDASSSAPESLKQENDQGSKPVGRLGIFLKDEEETTNKAVQGNEDDQKNAMDAGISDAERNKRLENLIARRRSRKLLSLHVRRSLMNMDRNEHSGAQIPSLILPKVNKTYSPSKIGGAFSPGPGSAPSVLIPMRNPFDLPYDPQEEKPDLTGDSFHQEFTSGNNRDMVFCRHESFSLGPSLPADFFEDRDETSPLRDFGFRGRGSATGFHLSKLGNESDKEFEVTESKSNNVSPEDDDDQIKEIIQVHENAARDHSEEGGSEVETRQVPRDEFSSSSSSPSSSEEGQPVFKIDKEAILKSLSFMRRNNLQEIENNERIGDNLSYANSALENASRLKQQHYADKPLKRHAGSHSIASDMQVEVSEVSSPPLTIDENMSYRDEDLSTYGGEMERDISWDGEDLWAGSSRASEADDNDSRSIQVDEVNEQDIIDVGVSRIQLCSSNAELSDNGDKILQDENEPQIKRYATVESNASTKSSEDSGEMVEGSSTNVENHVNIQPAQRTQDEQSSGEASISQAAVVSNDPREQSLMPNLDARHVQISSMISPTSVLLPTFSLLSYDPDVNEDIQQSEANAAEVSSPAVLRNSTALMQQSGDPPHSGGGAEISQESSEPKNASAIEADCAESVNDKMKIQENDEQPEEVESSSSEILEIHEAHAQPTGETSSRSAINTDEVSSKDFEAENSTALMKNVDQTDNSVPSLSTEEELSKHQETVIGEQTHGDSTKTSNYEDQTENSALHEETGHERQTNSTASSRSDGTKDEVQVFGRDETPAALSGLVEDDSNSESYMKREADRKHEQYANSHEARPEAVNILDNETK